jgi:hypothetical protein
LGGDDEFPRVNLTALQFLTLNPKWTPGVRSMGGLNFGDEPF